MSRDRARVLWATAGLAEDAELPSAIAPLYDVVTVRGPGELVGQAGELRPELIVVDGSLVEGGADEGLMELLGRPAPIPVIVLADPYDDVQAARCLDLGAADYLSRGVAPAELRARMDKAIREGRLRRELSLLARTDALTGLANFRALMARLTEEFARAERYEHPLSVVMLDLDYLKEINDRHGHEVGNRAICALTRTLREGLRQTDFAARYGGDEFVILLPYQSPAEALAIVERLRRSLLALSLKGPDGAPLDVRLTVSAGIAAHTAEDPRQSGEGLLQVADAALYQAKRTGRNRVVVFDRRDGAAEERI